MDVSNSTDWGSMQKEWHTYGPQLMDYERKVINLIASDNPPYQGHMIQERSNDVWGSH